jgi:hypothetical protein
MVGSAGMSSQGRREICEEPAPAAHDVFEYTDKFLGFENIVGRWTHQRRRRPRCWRFWLGTTLADVSLQMCGRREHNNVSKRDCVLKENNVRELTCMEVPQHLFISVITYMATLRAGCQSPRPSLDGLSFALSEHAPAHCHHHEIAHTDPGRHGCPRGQRIMLILKVAPKRQELEDSKRRAHQRRRAPEEIERLVVVPTHPPLALACAGYHDLHEIAARAYHPPRSLRHATTMQCNQNEIIAEPSWRAMQ